MLETAHEVAGKVGKDCVGAATVEQSSRFVVADETDAGNVTNVDDAEVSSDVPAEPSGEEKSDAELEGVKVIRAVVTGVVIEPVGFGTPPDASPESISKTLLMESA